VPAHFPKLAGVFPIVGNIVVELGLPKLNVGFGHGGDLAVFVAVPEAAVHEDDGVVFAQDDVGLAGQILAAAV